MNNCSIHTKMSYLLDRPRLVTEGAAPKDGVPDMTVISEIDEYGINENLRVRYQKDRIYVRVFYHQTACLINSLRLLDLHWLNSCGCKSLQRAEHL